MSQHATTWTSQEPKHISIHLPDEFSSSDYGEVIPVQEGPGSCLMLSRNHIIAASGPTILVYSLLDGRLIHSLVGHEKPVIWFLAVYQDILVTSSTDHTVRFWDLVSGQCLHVSKGPALVACIVKPELVEVERSGAPTRGKWPKKPLIVMNIFFRSILRIMSLPYPGERLFKAIDDDASKDPYFMHDVQIHPVQCLAARGRIAVTGSSDCTVRTWDIITGDCKWVFIGHTGRVMSLGLDQSMVYSGSSDGTVRTWNLQTGECSYILEVGSSAINQVNISPSYLSFKSFSHAVGIWNRQMNYQLPEDFVTSFQNDDRKILTARLGSVKLWDIHSGTPLKTLRYDDHSYIKMVGFRGRFCFACVGDPKHGFSLELWEFADEDGWAEEELEPEKEDETGQDESI